jgi:cholera toxin transcriptional activator
MGTQPSQPKQIVFGAFTYDGPAGELRKHGTRLRLAGQLLQILDMLLERPGQAVAREELQRRLWEATTFVDFEHGLNAAVNKLRQVLGDSADQPRYRNAARQRVPVHRRRPHLTQSGSGDCRAGIN